jgi:thioredoxin reductase
LSSRTSPSAARPGSSSRIENYLGFPGGVSGAELARAAIKNLRRYRTIEIQAGEHTITAADPLPDNIHTVIEAIKTRAAAH